MGTKRALIVYTNFPHFRSRGEDRRVADLVTSEISTKFLQRATASDWAMLKVNYRRSTFGGSNQNLHVCINKALMSLLPLLEWNQSNGKDRYSSYTLLYFSFLANFSSTSPVFL